ncbi:LuxR C-terminal-related transcriptional regulator [uncultured Microbacterium sp.]|uniref:LuxR C-terminal-related transcriptional regulator n=1 Tax=uncultured Microbacterium sp. TaxID=191216 RepID=UPI0028DC5076|nr:LuxR C-terminal-related transcriptional regulator [uncultured Microbacterium sp.]
MQATVNSYSAPTDDVGALLRRLSDLGTPCAPHVLARLRVEVEDDDRAIVEVAARLTSTQRNGLAPLPSPLPATPAITQAFRSLDLTTRDRVLLFALSVVLNDELEPLLALDGRDAAEVGRSAIGDLVELRAGRIRLADRRLAPWIAERTPASEAALIHEQLHRVFQARGRTTAAAWHRARASLHADASVAATLVGAARGESEAGRSDRALLLAREAAAHANGAVLDEARQVAGAAAVAGGYAAEASGWLAPLMSEGAETFRLRGLAAFVIAQAHLHGSVPSIDPATIRPRSDAAEDWYASARAAALAAALCAERGDRRGMRRWAGILHESAARVGVERSLGDPTVALSWMLLGEPDAPEARGTGPVTGVLLRALTAAVEGRVDDGIRLLAHGASLGGDVDPLVEGFERSPVVAAYRAVAHALLILWRGDVSTARDRLLAAAQSHPISVPFAGLGVVLARRLDLAVLGHVGPVAAALTAALPPPRRIDVLLDRAIERFLAGDFTAAAESSRLWRDTGNAGPTLAVPGLEEVGGPSTPDDERPMIAPPDMRETQRLLQGIAAVPEARWTAERSDIADAARGIASPFLRARVEAMLGVRCAVAGEDADAGEHLRAASRLFELSGARAWQVATERRLDRLVGLPSSVADPLAASRAAWAPYLTARELDVAMRAAAGAPNRDIAHALSISVRTVEVHLGRAFTKLGVRSRVELTVRAHRMGRLL